MTQLAEHQTRSARAANVSAPFLLAMVRSFGTDPVGVGTSAGYIVSAFFLTQVCGVSLALSLFLLVSG